MKRRPWLYVMVWLIFIRLFTVPAQDVSEGDDEIDFWYEPQPSTTA